MQSLQEFDAREMYLIVSRGLLGAPVQGDIQVIPVELNLRKEKWLLLASYRPPCQNQKYFLDNMETLIDFHSKSSGKLLILGDLNMEVHESSLKTFIKERELYSMIKTPTCCKSVHGRCIDLLLTNSKYSFQKSQSFETGFSDFHHMIYTILKTTYVKKEPKIIKYRNYGKFSHEEFLAEVNNSLQTSKPESYDEFEEIIVKILDKHAPIKTAVVRGNNKPHMTKALKKAMMNRTRLKNIANKTKRPEDIDRYKAQRNLVVKLNRKEKRNFFVNLDPVTVGKEKSFWKTFKPLFSEKSSNGCQKIILVENEVIIDDETEISNLFNTYFVNIIDTLPIDSTVSSLEAPNASNDFVADAIKKYENHPCITKIKQHLTGNEVFEFKSVSPLEVWEEINKLDKSKKTSGEISTDVVKLISGCSLEHITYFINKMFSSNEFPGKLKLADVSPIFKCGESTQKANFRPISVLSALSKVFERIMSKQIQPFTSKFLSSLLCAFRNGHSTQHALFRLIETCRKTLDDKGVVGMVLMDLSST